MMKHRKAKWQPEAPADAEARRELPRAAGAYLRAGRKATRNETSASRLHEFRLATKHFRYMLESFQPLYSTSRLRPYFEKLKRIQKVLGELNDYAVTAEMMAKEHGADCELLLGYLEKQHKRSLKRFLQYWDANFGSLEQKSQWVDGLR